VKDQKIFKVLYNQGQDNVIEVPFNDIKMNLNDLIILKPSLVGGSSGSGKPVFARFQHAPIGMMACPC
jgi:hypothetical protein